MKVTKLIYIGCALMIVVVGIAAALSWYVKMSTGPKYENGKLILETSQGQVLTTDIYKLKISTIPDTDTFVFVSNEDSIISYNPSLYEFVIVLLKPERRQTVEKKFLETLGIERKQACLLNVTIGVPYDISPESSQDFEFTFCRS